MNRRRFGSLSLTCLAGWSFATAGDANALTLAELTNSQASQGLAVALEKGAFSAVSQLGKSNGFMGNEKIRIPLPGYLEDSAKLLRTFGQGARLDELVLAMNSAAEAAVPMAKDLLMGAVRSMTIQDARKILGGGPTSATQYFTEKTRQSLAQKFLPVVTETTSRVGLAQKYNQLAQRAAGLGLLKGDVISIEQYVTAKTLDGLYYMIGEEEIKIRQNPAAAGSAVLKMVFGVLR